MQIGVERKACRILKDMRGHRAIFDHICHRTYMVSEPICSGSPEGSPSWKTPRAAKQSRTRGLTALRPSATMHMTT